MNIKNYIFNLIEDYRLTHTKNRRKILIESWDKVSSYIKKNPDNLDYKEIINIVSEYLSMVHDYGLLEKGDLFDLNKLYRKKDLGANFDYNPMDKNLKIFGNREFFIYLSKLFYNIVKSEDYFKKIKKDDSKENIIEFTVSLKKDKKNNDKKRKIDLENLLAVQFIKWKPGKKNISWVKLYSILEINEFDADSIEGYDFVKFPEKNNDQLWAFTIKNDIDEIVQFTAALSDENILFVSKKDLDQLKRDTKDV
ncbi:MAG: hypothetical protein FXF47_03130 [Candidatus Mcinerneyibacterium aminivorans]|uniref:Uncharacterized protein n=1 Tax=Candidatus Mcinerneyibacterium aminivorans TaxID=2703815 RepID=A0A5D0MJ12_9BACT|nr:MAG: hypothetical protein FXF47_03130 [Candidatus Mcinerneyibacterium aminivorans]